MYTKKPKEMGSQLMICELVYCLNDAATIGHDLTESETRRTALQNYLGGFLIYPFPQHSKKL